MYNCIVIACGVKYSVSVVSSNIERYNLTIDNIKCILFLSR